MTELYVEYSTETTVMKLTRAIFNAHYTSVLQLWSLTQFRELISRFSRNYTFCLTSGAHGRLL